MLYLLDTNVLSEPLKQLPDATLMAMLEKHRARVATAAPVWHELQFGCFRLPRSRKRDYIEQYLSHVLLSKISILPYDEAASLWHAKERARLETIGRTPSFVDGQIAAIAKVNGLVLVTRNTKDFKMFLDLQLENWSALSAEYSSD